MATQQSKPSPSDDRDARIQRILRQVEKKLRHSLPDPDQPLEKTEREVVEIGQEIREVIERETLDALGSGYQGSHFTCACGRSARYVALIGRHLVTLNGARRLVRAYYHCTACRRGFCPLDARLGIGRGESSVGVRALAARFASYLPFEKATQELEQVTGVRLSARTVEREAEAVGDALARLFTEREQRLWAGRAPRPTARPQRLHVTMDGVHVPIGKQWKEAKVGSVYQTRPDGGVAHARYLATRADSASFGRRLRTLAQEEGVAFCRQVAVVGDGAEWIWQEAAKHFPEAVEILDYYHVTEHLWEVARARYPEEGAAREWMQRQQERLLSDRVSAVIGDLEEWAPQREAEREMRRRVGNYLRHHAHRMRYQTFREAGYHIGSGVAEAGCKSVVQARLKGTGMRWSEAGAEAMLHLRAAWCSTGRTDFLAASRRAALPS